MRPGPRPAAPDQAIAEAPVGPVAVEARDRRYRCLLAGADAVTAALALVLCVELPGDDRLLAGSVLFVALVVAASKVKGLYDRDELVVRKTTLDEAPKLFQVATLCTLLFWLLEDGLAAGGLTHGQVLALWATLFASSVLARRTARSIARRVTPVERLLFVGDAGSYERLRSRLEHDDIRAELVGRMSLHRVARRFPHRRAGEDELEEMIDWADVHRVIIEPQALSPDEMLDFVRAAKGIGVRVSLIPRVLDVVGGSVVFDDLHGMTVMGVRRFGLTRSSMLVKRAFDLTCVTLALPFVLPVMAVIAVLVKLDSRGPVMFRQTRVGRGGRAFQIWKFRTMCSDAEELKVDLLKYNEVSGGMFKIAEDPRVTRVGRWLRRSSLDELPQLLNVLAGDMSLVGPRPLVVDEDDKITGRDRGRLHLTPGMTGHWQIAAARAPLPEMVKMDYLYISTWSLWADLKILLRTVPFILSRRGM